jgi:hypothetical protein
VSRNTDAYVDLVHHLAWLAASDHDESGAIPSATSRLLDEVSALTDWPPHIATPANYVQGALDLLALAIADSERPADLRDLRAARDVLDRRLALMRRRLS